MYFKSSGSQYNVGFPRNMPGATQQLLVTTYNREPVEFTVRTSTQTLFVGTATHNTTTLVDLGSSHQVKNNSDRLNGIAISSKLESKTLVVYGLNYQPYTSDSFLALPCTNLGVTEYEYFAVSYGNASGPNQILLVACKGNTTVTYGESIINLNELETFLIEDSIDTTGKRFVSDKPITFFAGHLCTYIPRDVLACDHIIEQLPPSRVWGRTFLTASLSGRISGDIYRIVTASRFNNVDVYCVSPHSQIVNYRYRLSLELVGDWEEIVVPSRYFCSIEGTSPLLVVQFGLAHRTDYMGDPFMMTIPSVEQYGNFFTVSALAGFSESFATILVPVDIFQPSEIFFDGDNLENAEWNTIYCPNERVCGYATYVLLTKGDHRVYHSNAASVIGVLVYGFDSFNSYGHPAGVQFIPEDCKSLQIHVKLTTK